MFANFFFQREKPSNFFEHVCMSPHNSIFLVCPKPVCKQNVPLFVGTTNSISFVSNEIFLNFSKKFKGRSGRMSTTEILENAGFTQLCLLNSVSFMFAKDVTTTKCYYSGRKDGFRVFIKTSTNEKELYNERNRLSTPFLKHPNIVELYDIHLDPKILIFPFHSGGNLEEMIDIRLYVAKQLITSAFSEC